MVCSGQPRPNDAVLELDRERTGQERRELLGDADRARARAAAAVRRRERLVQVDVHGVEAHVARARLAEDRVEVRAVAVRVRADRVHRLGDLERSASRTARSVLGFVSMNAATSVSSAALSASRSTSPVLVAGDRDGLPAAHRDADAGFVPCAVSGMMTFLRASPRAVCAARNTISAVSSPWAPAAGCSVTPGRPRDLGERVGQADHELERALDGLLGLVRVDARESGKPAGVLVDARVVLHRAASRAGTCPSRRRSSSTPGARSGA